jgi:hypothetical protein
MSPLHLDLTISFFESEHRQPHLRSIYARLQVRNLQSEFQPKGVPP